MNTSLNALIRELDAFAVLLTPDLPTDMARVSRRRVEVARATNAFFADTREGVGDPIHRVVSEVREADRSRLFKAFAEVRMRYSAHIARWDNRSVAASWSDYRRDCLALIYTMRGLLAEKARSATLGA